MSKEKVIVQALPERFQSLSEVKKEKIEPKNWRKSFSTVLRENREGLEEYFDNADKKEQMELAQYILDDLDLGAYSESIQEYISEGEDYIWYHIDDQAGNIAVTYRSQGEKYGLSVPEERFEKDKWLPELQKWSGDMDLIKTSNIPLDVQNDLIDWYDQWDYLDSLNTFLQNNTQVREFIDDIYLPKYTSISVSYELGSLAKSLSSDIQPDKTLDGYASEGLKATQDQWQDLIEEMVFEYERISSGDHDLSKKEAKSIKRNLTLLYKKIWYNEPFSDDVNKKFKELKKELKKLKSNFPNTKYRTQGDIHSEYLTQLTNIRDKQKLGMVLDDYIKLYESIMTKARAEATGENNTQVKKSIEKLTKEDFMEQNKDAKIRKIGTFPKRERHLQSGGYDSIETVDHPLLGVTIDGFQYTLYKDDEAYVPTKETKEELGWKESDELAFYLRGWTRKDVLANLKNSVYAVKYKGDHWEKHHASRSRFGSR